jgi:mannose-6-phosphate isomerase
MIYHLDPNVQRKIWGGKNLERLKNLPVELGSDPVGETWEISIHHDGPSLYQDSILDFDDYELPYLVKFIDTGDVLSVQVHPHDEYARAHENSNGKTECWVILKAQEGAGIYLGLKENVNREKFLAGLDQKANMSEFLNFYQVSAGDFYYVPPGTIHAISAGILMAEVQQSSGVTYRVWDWDRVDSKGKPRELHVKKSLDVINFDPAANTKSHFKIKHDLFRHNGLHQIVTHPSFKMSLVNLAKNQTIELSLPKQKRLRSLLNFQGKVSINEEMVNPYSSVLFKDEDKVKIQALEETSFLFLE